MRAVRLHGQGLDTLVVEEVETPRPASGEALVEVRAAAITRDEIEWPQDRLPAIPSYELAGVADGEPVYALTPFDRDGVAAELAAVREDLLARKPQTLDDVQSAAVPLPALSAWQDLFDTARWPRGSAY
jgi:NADPH:quinone reductase-like Zn-dependent oxidoreductase